jgi:hypothetical protein
MNYDSFTVIKNAKLAIERAEKITKKSREDLKKYKMDEKESRECNPYIWKTLDDINYKLNMIIKSLNL